MLTNVTKKIAFLHRLSNTNFLGEKKEKHNDDSWMLVCVMSFDIKIFNSEMEDPLKSKLIILAFIRRFEKCSESGQKNLL
jgi:hypothetical protein